MSWLTRLFGLETKAATGVPAIGGIPPLGSIPTASGMLISQASAMCVSSVYACVTIRAEDVARCTPSLYVKKDDGTRGERVDDHPIARLLKKPNRIQTLFEFLEQMQGALLLRSNAYAAILRDADGNPVELIPINPDAVMVLEAQDGSIFYNVNRLGLFQLWVLRGFPTMIPAEDMFHLRGLSFNMLVAASRIALARDSIGLAMGMDQQASRWMDNGARPSGVLKSPKQLTPETAQRLKTQWENFTRGVQNAGNTAVLEEGLDWVQLSLDAGQLDFFNQRNFQVEDVCRWFRMPPHKVGRLERTAATGLAQQNQDYVSNTISPDLVRWEQKIERTFDLEQEGLMVDFDEGLLLRADILTRYNAARIGILSGMLTPNEARAADNLPPKPGGDNLLVPANTAALGSDMTGTGADGAGAPGAAIVPKPGVGTGGDQPAAEDLAPED